MTVLLDILPVVTASPAETTALGRDLADLLQEGDVVALYGDLGAGKTHLVKGIAEALGADPEDVTSPTFTLIQEYSTNPPLYHLDLYRIETDDELERLGLTEYFYGDGICVVEWPERAESLFPESVLRLQLHHKEDGSRRVEQRPNS